MTSRLAPVFEEPVDEDDSIKGHGGCARKGRLSWRGWIGGKFPCGRVGRESDLRILLSVLGCPLFPLSLHPKPAIDKVSSSAQYIIQHFTAATGCRKLEGRVKNVFLTGKVMMKMGEGDAVPGSGISWWKGCFVMWQMVPDKWLLELVVGDQKVIAGSDGKVAWRHTPWLGTHAAKGGGVRPIRRALQGLDPLAIARVFSSSRFMGDKEIAGTNCFVLRLCVDHGDLADRGDNSAETIKHSVHGYFSQRSGLLVHLEDSYLTRIQSPGTTPTYWETTMSTEINDYQAVEGVMVAHSGRTTAVISRFGEDLRTGPTVTRMEETWSIDDFAMDVAGLSVDSFIPPKGC